jgi:hypothetical protein
MPEGTQSSFGHCQHQAGAGILINYYSITCTTAYGLSFWAVKLLAVVFVHAAMIRM